MWYRKILFKGKVLCTCQNNHTLIYLTSYSNRQLGPKCKSPLAKKLSKIKTSSPLPPFFFFLLYFESQAHLVLYFVSFLILGSFGISLYQIGFSPLILWNFYFHCIYILAQNSEF